MSAFGLFSLNVRMGQHSWCSENSVYSYFQQRVRMKKRELLMKNYLNCFPNMLLDPIDTKRKVHDLHLIVIISMHLSSLALLREKSAMNSTANGRRKS